MSGDWTDATRWPVAVMGAGAVGCYYGAMLARAGHPVTLIGRALHVEAAGRDGLHLESRAFTGHVPVRASVDAAAGAGARLVLFCVKSTDTETAGAQLATRLPAESVVLSLQNGVDNADRLARVLGREVLPAVVYVATEMVGPGRVRHHGRGELVIGRSAASDALVRLFAAADVPVQVSDNVTGALWAKLIVNCAYNALSAIGQLPYGRMVRSPGIAAAMDDVVGECLAVARAAGVTMPADLRESVRRIAQTMAGQVSSTAQDLARGKPSEIDHLNGYVARLGESLGVPTPVNRLLHALVRMLENNRTERAS